MPWHPTNARGRYDFMGSFAVNISAPFLRKRFKSVVRNALGEMSSHLRLLEVGIDCILQTVEGILDDESNCK